MHCFLCDQSCLHSHSLSLYIILVVDVRSEEFKISIIVPLMLILSMILSLELLDCQLIGGCSQVILTYIVYNPNLRCLSIHTGES